SRFLPPNACALTEAKLRLCGRAERGMAPIMHARAGRGCGKEMVSSQQVVWARLSKPRRASLPQYGTAPETELPRELLGFAPPGGPRGRASPADRDGIPPYAAGDMTFGLAASVTPKCWHA